MECLNDLLGFSNRKIYQDSDKFKFSLDGVLLANFIDLKKSTKKILDIGAGTGIIPLLLSLKTNLPIDAVEIQKDLFLLLKKNVIYNSLQDQIHIVNEDIKEYSKNIKYLNYYDIVVSNPPYYQKQSKTDSKSISKCENYLSIEEVLKCSKKILKDHGSIFLVYPSKDFQRVLMCLNKENFSVNKIQFVHHTNKTESSIFLVEGVKNGKTEITVLPPFILYKDNNQMTDEYKKYIMEK